MKYVQALSLLEILSHPDPNSIENKHIQFKEVKKIIARHVAKQRQDYDALLRRFEELGNGNKTTRGYRERIVHHGDRIETIVPDNQERQKLFQEIQGYIRTVILAIVQHSDKSWSDFQDYQDRLKTDLEI
jgi:hypothetical protein